MKGAFIAACALAALYLAAVALLYWRQSAMIHLPSKHIFQTPADVGLQYEDVWLKPEKDVKLHGWMMPHPNSRLTVLFMHGNAGNMALPLETYEIFHDLELSVFTYDYRKYGNSTGDLTEDGMYRDAQAAWEYLTETRGVSPDEIIVFGRSLGGAMASWVAANNDPAALVMESTFTSLADMADTYYRWLPAKRLLKWRYDSLSRIREVNAPVLIVHSRQDRLVPFALGEMLFQSAPGDRTFLEIFGGHNEGFFDSGETYVNGLREFFSAL